MPPTTPQANVPLLHKFLGIGMVLLAGAFIVATSMGFAPLLLEGDDVTQVLAYTLPAMSTILVVAALFVFKPRVPERTPGQTVDQYWATPDVAAKVLLVWFVLEGGGTLAAVAYLLTSAIVAAIVMGAAIVAFWLCGPNAFAKA